jgi:hypothetical protein
MRTVFYGGERRLTQCPMENAAENAERFSYNQSYRCLKNILYNTVWIFFKIKFIMLYLGSCINICYLRCVKLTFNILQSIPIQLIKCFEWLAKRFILLKGVFAVKFTWKVVFIQEIRYYNDDWPMIAKWKMCMYWVLNKTLLFVKRLPHTFFI